MHMYILKIVHERIPNNVYTPNIPTLLVYVTDKQCLVYDHLVYKHYWV